MLTAVGTSIREKEEAGREMKKGGREGKGKKLVVSKFAQLCYYIYFGSYQRIDEHTYTT